METILNGFRVGLFGYTRTCSRGAVKLPFGDQSVRELLKENRVSAKVGVKRTAGSDSALGICNELMDGDILNRYRSWQVRSSGEAGTERSFSKLYPPAERIADRSLEC